MSAARRVKRTHPRGGGRGFCGGPPGAARSSQTIKRFAKAVREGLKVESESFETFWLIMGCILGPLSDLASRSPTHTHRPSVCVADGGGPLVSRRAAAVGGASDGLHSPLRYPLPSPPPPAASARRPGVQPSSGPAWKRSRSVRRITRRSARKEAQNHGTAYSAVISPMKL
ncbi:hypothetical protein EYF80_018147 [Liparis tanakae]|uniref:Uncharacterized protein n=1 Tax=Liparis tanakae TaxID=230148 RepID=A0A4Z2I2Z4_9TELE|nr:hypothetical protein EYF80_018147 [Liparis tanakae]